MEEIYHWQLARQEGPLFESMHRHTTVLIRDTATEQRWPDWAAKMLSLEVRSVLDVPLTTAAGTVGVLGLYSATPDAFGTDDQAIAKILARHASMERYSIDEDCAFEVLKRYSQDTNTTLRDVAQQLINTRQLPR
ncbi:GAF and ANTAR domain-containing protein [Kribbella pittospori]|uniref:GAF and ANTAR domain-containing protein n=1 Tax=Kribbella pittospori TaxID=722689 RepID=UPI0026CFA0AC